MKKTLLLAFVSMFAMQAHASTDELISSVKSNDISKVLELFSNGEDPNGINEQGNTALHYAVALDNADMTQILLSYGADISVANLKGWTPLKIAEKKDLKNVTPILVQYLQLQKNKQELAEFSENVEKISGSIPTEAVAVVQEKVVEIIPQEVKDVAGEPITPETAPAEAVAFVQEKVVEVIPQEVKEVASEPVAPENVPAEAEAVVQEQVVEAVPQAAAEVTSEPVAPENVPAEAVAVVQEQVAEVIPQAATEVTSEPVAPENTPTEAVAVVQEQVVEAVPQAVAEVANEPAVPENAPEQSSENAQTPDIQEIIAHFSQAATDAKNAQDIAEAQNKELNEELNKLKAEKAELEKKLAQKETENKAKASSKPVKPILNKKPVYKAPKPIVKKAVITPSSMVDGIYAGDEEIVYCLDYLGNGDNDNMKRAAGYYAASVSISEDRYKQIVDKANDFFMKSEADNMTKRDNECSKIITPSDKNKQNIIVRSMNKSVGY